MRWRVSDSCRDAAIDSYLSVANGDILAPNWGGMLAILLLVSNYTVLFCSTKGGNHMSSTFKVYNREQLEKRDKALETFRGRMGKGAQVFYSEEGARLALMPNGIISVDANSILEKGELDKMRKIAETIRKKK